MASIFRNIRDGKIFVNKFMKSLYVGREWPSVVESLAVGACAPDAEGLEQADETSNHITERCSSVYLWRDRLE